MSPLFLIVTAWVGLSVIFGIFFIVARRINNYGIVDIVWSYAFSALGIYYAMVSDGWAVRRATIAGMATLWSMRLGTHLYWRVIGHHPVEDGRYAQLRKEWAANFTPKMAGFFQMQAASVVTLGVGFFVVCLNRDPSFHSLEISGVILWLLAWVGEAIADAQLAAFKRNRGNKGRVCNIGLWHFCRHPNYFFEWLIWISYLVFALASPWGWLAAIGPLSILYLLLRVTGIPLTEEQSVRSKGDAYRQYQKTTSAFVPWFPKKS